MPDPRLSRIKERNSKQKKMNETNQFKSSSFQVIKDLKKMTRI